MDASESELLRRTAELAIAFRESLPARPVGESATADELRRTLGGPLPEQGLPWTEVVEQLAAAAEPGTVAMAGPRYFGFVIGGTHPAALAADWLTSAWDQNAKLYVAAPAAMVVEEVAGGWLKELLGLPAGASVGYTTGSMMANWTALAAARHALLARHGWDVERRGLHGAPELQVVVGAEAHATILLALQYLGLGRERVTIVPTDDGGRMRPDGLAETLGQLDGPVLVCAQAGNVNTGAFDPLEPIAAAARAREAWLHVDSAFGLWAAVSPRFSALLAGHDLADSWATDAHKWLNVPYDSGLVFCAHPEAHRAAMSIEAAYLVQDTGERDGFEWAPEFSRRARGFAVYAALRALGREGVRAMIERCCDNAARMALRLAAAEGVEIISEVVLNQVLVRFRPRGSRPAAGGDEAAADGLTRRVIGAVQRDGTCWLGGTTWHGRAAMRVSVTNWTTTPDDIDRSADAILRCYGEEAAA